jgi:3-dehydroquinate synthase
MRLLQNTFTVSFSYGVHFTQGLFKESNNLFNEVLPANNEACGRKILFVIDQEVHKHHPSLSKEIKAFFNGHKGIELCQEIVLVEGGEQVKNNISHVDRVISAMEKNGLCRHSFVACIGGGAVLDMVGYAAAIAHRGIRHIRIPTTVLSQNDSGIGVKNGVNAYNKKNFLGTFSPPFAVINDSDFLLTLEDRDWRSGISEAIKVALIKDAKFYNFILENADKLVRRDMSAMEYLIHRCAELHMNHIAGGDPFEKGSSRPLDFGHWSAHKLEQMTNY